jgi:hypothetical protein
MTRPRSLSDFVRRLLKNGVRHLGLKSDFFSDSEERE